MVGEPPHTQKRVTPTAKVFQCPNCGGSVKIRALGQSLSVTCESCHSLIDVTDENYVILAKFAAKTRITPTLPLGTRGKLEGHSWEVVGFVQRKDSIYVWSEYLLYNPYYGFRWLVEFDGHWNYVTMTKLRPTESSGGTRASFLGETYQTFLKGSAEVIYVRGEFYWRVMVGEKVQTMDFVRPPKTLTKEWNSEETVWSTAVYLEPSEVANAFGVKGPMPTRVGVGASQPAPFSGQAGKILFTGLIFATLLTLIQFKTSAASIGSVAHREGFTHNAGDNGKVRSSERFELRGEMANVEIQSGARMNNQWIALSMTLTQDKEGAAAPAPSPTPSPGASPALSAAPPPVDENAVTFPVTEELSYYSGVDGGESWSEGGCCASTTISSVPGGRYFLTIQSESDANSTIPVNISVVRDVPVWSNYFLALLMVSVLPIVAGIRRHMFEVRRWSNSDYSPYG